MAKPTKPRLIDIAKQAGVSVAAVSAVINESPMIKVSAKTQREILEIAAQLNYRSPHSGLLKTGLTVRVFTGASRDNLMAMDILSGIETFLLPVKGNMLVSLLPEEDGTRGASWDWDHLLDGVHGVIFQSRAPESALAELRKRAVPTVVIGTRTVRDDVDMVYARYPNYVPLALERLVALGHKHTVLVTGPLPHDCYLMASLMFCRHGQELGMADPQQNIMTATSTSSLLATVKSILAMRQRPTAIFGWIANIRDVIEAAGIRVPEDISLISFDYGGSADVENVSFIGTDNKQLGREAVNLLSLRLADPSTPLRHLTLPLSFHDRGSCGPSLGKRVR